MSKFAIMLKSLREEFGLNQTELAKKLGMTRSRYANYELGIREPDLDTLELISDFFNVDVDYILGKTSKTTKYTKAHDEIQLDDENIKTIAAHLEGVDLDEEEMSKLTSYIDFLVQEVKKNKK